jgi:hypothetical protein
MSRQSLIDAPGDLHRVMCRVAEPGNVFRNNQDETGVRGSVQPDFQGDTNEAPY